MVQKHIIVSMIAFVAIAGILIMAVMANQAYSSSVSSSSVKCKTTQAGVTTCKTKTKTTRPLPQVSKTVKMPQVRTTVKMGATKTAYRAQGASNSKKRTELTISATQTGPPKTEENNASGEIYTLVPVTLSGRLTSDDSGVAGASLRAANAEVVFDCEGGDSTCWGEELTNTGAHVTQSSTDTDSGGHYSVVVLLDYYHKTHKIDVTLQPSNPNEPGGYEKSHATTTIQLNKGSPEGKQTELTISVTPTGPTKGRNIPVNISVKISGRLTSEGSGVAGATIRIWSFYTRPHDATTDSGGHYSVATTISREDTSTYQIHAITKHIPNNYEDSKATTTIKLPELR